MKNRFSQAFAFANATCTATRRDQEKRAAALEDQKEKEELRATLIEYNLEQVDTVGFVHVEY